MISITIQRDGVPFAEITTTHTSGGRIDEHAVTVWAYLPDRVQVRVPAGTVCHDRANGPWDLVSGAVGAALAVMSERSDAEC
jgi:hypothetical protein